MNKFLYGTTALVTAVLAAGWARADNGGIKLGLSGYYRASAGFLIGGDQTPVNFVNTKGIIVTPGHALKTGKTTKPGGLGDFGRTSGGFRQEIRINFTGQTTLDNGITVAVLVSLNPNGAQGQSREFWSAADFSGKYGDLRFGDGRRADPIYQNCVYDPGNVTSNFGINSSNQVFTNAGLARSAGGAVNTVGVATFEDAVATCLTLTHRGTSIAYFSPSFAGFTFAVSYTPESGQTLTSGSQGFGAGTNLKSAIAENVLTATANYTHDFGGGWTLTAGGGGAWAFGGHTSAGAGISNKPSIYQLGFQVGIPGGWTAGASGEHFVNYPHDTPDFAATDAGTSGADGWAGVVGVAYVIGDLSLGLEGGLGRYQVHQGSPSAGHDNIWGVDLNAAYALGKGVNLEGMIAYTKYNPAVGTPSSTNPMSYDAVELDAGIAINF